MLVLIKNCNCNYISHIAKKRESKDEQMCIIVHTINNNICDANPLDNLSNKVQLRQHCLT